MPFSAPSMERVKCGVEAMVQQEEGRAERSKWCAAWCAWCVLRGPDVTVVGPTLSVVGACHLPESVGIGALESLRDMCQRKMQCGTGRSLARLARLAHGY